MEAIHKRFSGITLSLFEKHGIQVVDFWEDHENNKLYYIVQAPNHEARDRQWASFGQDPLWKEAKADSEKDGPIVEKVESVFMTRVPYWPRG